MTDQNRSSDGVPHKDGRPSPDVEGYATDGQSNARGKGATDEQGDKPPYAGDGPGKVGLTSDAQPDLVASSGVNERDSGSANDEVNLDDFSEEHPRGNTARTGGTWEATGGDSGRMDKAPGAGMSDTNGPSDPDGKNAEPGRPR